MDFPEAPAFSWGFLGKIGLCLLLIKGNSHPYLPVPRVSLDGVGQKGRVVAGVGPEKADSRYQLGTLILAVGLQVTQGFHLLVNQ